MKEIIKKIATTTNSEEREQYMLDFIVKFWQAVYKGDFFWAMSDPIEALRLYGHQEIGWFNSKTEEYRKNHPDSSVILQKRLRWSSDNIGNVRLDIKYPETNHQLLCVEMKLKTEKYSPEMNFYLKIGMIPVWNDDYSKIVDYLDKPVVDFHDQLTQLERKARRTLKLP